MSNYEKIFLSAPHMSGNEIKYIQEAFDINWVAPLGPHLDQLEKDLSKGHSDYSCVLMNTGTACIHIALRLLGIGKNDIVLCPSATFIASANPILYENANPVFVDSEMETWNICPEALALAINDLKKQGKKPEALILVHLYGTPAKIDEIISLCEAENIKIIEDAAEALGSKYKGRPCGTFGDFGILSFNGNKIITTSGGGALLCKNAGDAQKAKFLITQARDPAPWYQHSEVGFNYRMSNLLAGVGRAQYEVLESRVESRRKVFDYYTENIANNVFTFPITPEGTVPNRWLTTAMIQNEEVSPAELMKHLQEFNIETRPLWKPLHLQPLFKDVPFYQSANGKPICERIFERGICIPSSSFLKDKDLEFVCDKINSYFS